MRVGIQLDCFSGHLFHEIELLMLLFSKCHTHDIVTLDYVHDTTDTERRAATTSSISKFQKNINNVKYLCNKLFNVDINVTRDSNHTYDVYIRRADLNQFEIGKAFAEVIISFPASEWHARITSNKKATGGLLYAARQNTSRKLTDKHDQMIRELVTEYRGTIIDDFSKYTLAEQVDIFSDHTCVLGVHGNNLSGVMWMHPGSVVLELLRTKFDKHSVYDYQAMSWCMRHRYTQMLCDGGCVEEWQNKNPWSFTEDTHNMLKRNLHLWNQLYVS